MKRLHVGPISVSDVPRSKTTRPQWKSQSQLENRAGPREENGTAQSSRSISAVESDRKRNRCRRLPALDQQTHPGRPKTRERPWGGVVCSPLFQPCCSSRRPTADLSVPPLFFFSRPELPGPSYRTPLALSILAAHTSVIRDYFWTQNLRCKRFQIIPNGTEYGNNNRQE